MRKARYDLKQVICRNSSLIGYSSNIAKPGYWVVIYHSAGAICVGRVMGRIAEVEHDGLDNCEGWLAVMILSSSLRSAGVSWIDPDRVAECYAQPPAALLTWITGNVWVKNKDDIARLIAMNEHGTTQDQFIDLRDDPEQAYNKRAEYTSQFVLV